jgi:spermidine synthase
VSVNGKGNSQLPYGSVHTYLGAVPVLMHAAPEQVAVIGLGSGDTAWAASCRRETRRVTVFELSRPQPLLLKRLLERDPYPPVATLLRDERLRLVMDDGRSSLDHGGALYDMIEADALRPHSAGSGNLYSLEFFQACARRLRPGGLVCTWAPTARIYASFCRAFPGALEMRTGETILVGSREPLAIDRGAWRARLESPEVLAHLGPGIAARVLEVFRSARRADPTEHGAGGPLNTDLFPRDEFLTP